MSYDEVALFDGILYNNFRVSSVLFPITLYTTVAGVLMPAGIRFHGGPSIHKTDKAIYPQKRECYVSLKALEPDLQQLTFRLIYLYLKYLLTTPSSLFILKTIVLNCHLILISHRHLSEESPTRPNTSLICLPPPMEDACYQQDSYIEREGRRGMSRPVPQPPASVISDVRF